jgi:hypothetical protein
MSTQRHQHDPSGEMIHLGNDRKRRRGNRTHYGFLLVVFMRIIAVLWMFQGLMQWKLILAPDELPLDALPTPIASAIVFFAVIDLLAAVGLWLASPWGGVLWIFSACASIGVALLMPGFHAGGRLVMGINFLLIVVYFVLTWKAAQEREF